MQLKSISSNRDLKKIMRDLRFDLWDAPSVDNAPYFSENHYFEFDAKEIDAIDDATSELHQMCLDYVADTVRSGDYANMGLNAQMIALIERSYKDSKDNHVYGRFDLGYDVTRGAIKLLEYNADTPTSLYESSIVQWDWLQHHFPNLDQFNAIHERLIERWQHFPDNVYFTAHQEADIEDWTTIFYLLDTYIQSAPIHQGHVINLGDIQFDDSSEQFFDTNNQAINHIFKLYPWEFMQEEAFIQHADKANYIEPSWKLLLSNKSLLPKLWEKHKGHPLLLESYFYHPNFKQQGFIKKPIFSREGANVSTTNHSDARDRQNHQFFDSAYDKHPYIVQKDANISVFNGYTPVLGSWVIGDTPSGMGIRMDKGFTRNTSLFVPHTFL